MEDKKVYQVKELTSNSTFHTLTNRTRTVIVKTEKDSNGKKVHWGLDIEIPAWFPNGEQLLDKQCMIDWLDDQSRLWAKSHPDEGPFDFVLGTLQAGLAQLLIGTWATVKPRPGSKEKAGEDIFTPEYIQAAFDRLNAFYPTLMKRPIAEKADKQAIQREANVKAGVTLVSVLKAQGMPIDAITAMVTQCYPGEVTTIMEQSA